MTYKKFRAVGVCPNYEESGLTGDELTKYYCNVNSMAQSINCLTRDSIKPYLKQAFFPASVSWRGQRSYLLR